MDVLFLFQQMTLVEGTAAYSEWLESSVPVYTKMYLFSVQNPDEILEQKAKPELKEMGPYTFRYCRKYSEDLTHMLRET